MFSLTVCSYWGRWNFLFPNRSISTFNIFVFSSWFTTYLPPTKTFSKIIHKTNEASLVTTTSTIFPAKNWNNGKVSFFNFSDFTLSSKVFSKEIDVKRTWSLSLTIYCSISFIRGNICRVLRWSWRISEFWDFILF